MQALACFFPSLKAVLQRVYTSTMRKRVCFLTLHSVALRACICCELHELLRIPATHFSLPQQRLGLTYAPPERPKFEIRHEEQAA